MMYLEPRRLAGCAGSTSATQPRPRFPRDAGRLAMADEMPASVNHDLRDAREPCGAE